ncbi:MAG: GNAT family N-acetyltransferase [Burkholderiaceae bacterium]
MTDPSLPTLSTARLSLRPTGMEDVPALFELFSDPRVTRYGSRPPWTDRRQAVEQVERDLAALAKGEAVRFAMLRRADDRLIGTCTLFHFDIECRRAEVGYMLAVAAWGQGYASEAVEAMLDWGFAARGLNRVEADIDPRNEASARLLERLGFTREGHLRERWIVGGEKSDSWLYGLLASEWASRPWR